MPQTNADKRSFRHKELTGISVFYDVYNELGHGFIESVYERAVELALTSAGIEVLRKIEIPVRFRGQAVGDFEADMTVEDSVLLEFKAVRALDSTHEAQLLNYLWATDIEVGLLLNFGIKPQLSEWCLTTVGSSSEIRRFHY